MRTEGQLSRAVRAQKSPHLDPLLSTQTARRLLPSMLHGNRRDERAVHTRLACFRLSLPRLPPALLLAPLPSPLLALALAPLPPALALILGPPVPTLACLLFRCSLTGSILRPKRSADCHSNARLRICG